MRYKELVERQKIKELKPIKVKKVTKNMRSSKYLVWWKRFMMEYNIWKKKEDLERSSSRVWGKNRCRSKKIGEVRYDSSSSDIIFPLISLLKSEYLFIIIYPVVTISSPTEYPAAAHTGTTLELNYTSSKSTNIQDGCLLISLVTMILTHLYIRALCSLWRTP